jgi:hypothetical protein
VAAGKRPAWRRDRTPSPWVLSLGEQAAPLSAPALPRGGCCLPRPASPRLITETARRRRQADLTQAVNVLSPTLSSPSQGREAQIFAATCLPSPATREIPSRTHGAAVELSSFRDRLCGVDTESRRAELKRACSGSSLAAQPKPHPVLSFEKPLDALSSRFRDWDAVNERNAESGTLDA